MLALGIVLGAFGTILFLCAIVAAVMLIGRNAVERSLWR